MSFHMLPMATGGTRIGRIMSVRTRPLPRATLPTRSARPSPSSVSAATEATTKINVFTIACRSTRSESSRSRLRMGVNVQMSRPWANSMVDTLMRVRFSIG
jgi:hypothetical protein